MRVQFEVMQREDITVAFRQALGPEALLALERLPGVTRVEPLREAPAHLVAGHRSRRLAVSGLDAGGELRRLVDRELRPVRIPPEGLVLSAKLAEILDVRPGDEVGLEFLEGRRTRASAQVSGLVDDYVGLGAYMDAAALQRLAGEGELYTGALLRVDPMQWTALNAELKRLPALSGAVSREATVRSFEEIVARTMFVTIAIEVLFACLIAFGLVYNGARIALSERGYELATLRVLGFTQRESVSLLLGEQAVITGAGLPMGVALGIALTLYFIWMLSTDMWRMPYVMTGLNLVGAMVAVAFAAAASGAAVAWKLRRLDLVGALKARE
jgi:putative ABC transport system permease protein